MQNVKANKAQESLQTSLQLKGNKNYREDDADIEQHNVMSIAKCDREPVSESKLAIMYCCCGKQICQNYPLYHNLEAESDSKYTGDKKEDHICFHGC